MNYPTTEGKNGLIYQIAEGVRVIPNSRGYWTLDAYKKGERLRRNFERGEEGLKKAIQTAELYVTKLGLKPKRIEERFVTMGEVAEKWLSGNQTRWSPATIERYSGLVSHFVRPRFGDMPIEKVDRFQLREHLIEVLAIRSAKSVEVLHAVYSGIFSEAIDRQYLESNPANGLLKKILPPKRKRNQSKPDPFCKEDLERFIQAAWDVLPQPLPLVFETLAYSGMRLGECLAMRWTQFDAINKQYMITETVRRENFGKPKTGERLIDLPDFLCEKLERHINGLRKEALRRGTEVKYLFPGVSQVNMQMAMKRVCRAAKLRARNPHDLRHTYATILLMDLVSPAYVQKQLGHHSITMTVDVYGTWIPGEGKGRVALDKTFGARGPVSLRLREAPFDRRRESNEV